MTPFLQLVLVLVLVITAAKLGGYFSNRLGQPSVLGELLVGILLGPSVINFLDWPFLTDTHLTETVEHLAEIGVLMLMFIAGLDLHLTDLIRSGKVSVLAGTLGVVVPLGMGFGLALGFSEDVPSAIFIGLILAATSVSISAQTLMELKVLRTRVGISLLGSAVFDDILVILGMSILVAFSQGGASTGFASVLGIVLQMVLFIAIAAALGLWLGPRLSRWVDNLPISQGLIAFSFVIMLLYAWSAEVLGSMAAITGAFLAGLVFARSPVKDRIEAGISSMAYGVFVPIFFVNVGLTANARELNAEIFWLFLTMTAVAIVGKVLGAGLGARLSGFSWREALQLGVGMMSRGEVGLIVATVGVLEGLIGEEVFAAVVGVVIVTTLLTPPMLRVLFAEEAIARQA
jgi:Kef-type K+ transport system membrane component KefB